ncbi:type II secretion system protein G [Anaerohalosphaera lusitana]|uniref:Type II secretion system protein G n=1 Tax=Anaerohalosphaera lusitana TaxID=1936003 RepID=A0A1U9NGC7_9BACT|nr:type II secretion system protein [Anaerohalosphaera lusitana]AQT66983.1 type II secretion system protein G [Anaerohalosphaera lusitana]
MRRQDRPKAFTLIELLVVIAIIALLLSIMMPALGIVKEKAKAVVCQSQVRDWGLAWTLYANDHDGTNLNHESAYFWFYKIAPYFSSSNFADNRGSAEGAMEVLVCPSTKPWSDAGNNSFGWGGYGRADMCWEWRRSADQGDDGSYTQGSYIASNWMMSNTGNANAYENISEAKSDAPILADGGFLRVSPTSEEAETSTELVNLQGDGKGDNLPMSDSIERLLLDRHGMATNVVFADAHAERVDLEDMWSLKWHKSFERVDKLELPSR